MDSLPLIVPVREIDVLAYFQLYLEGVQPMLLSIDPNLENIRDVLNEFLMTVITQNHGMNMLELFTKSTELPICLDSELVTKLTPVVQYLIKSHSPIACSEDCQITHLKSFLSRLGAK